MTTWNQQLEPISERLRNPEELAAISDTTVLMYNTRTKQTAIISEVFIVEQDENSIDQGYTIEEDRFVEYITDEGPKEDFSVDLDDEGWIWHDELKETQ